MRMAATIAAALALALPASAQTARPMLDYGTAAAIRDGCIAWAEARDLTVAIAVYDESGTLLAYAHMDGAANAVGDFAMWKGRSAARIHVASKETANWGQGAPGVASWEGGTPIFSPGGAALGGIGVSGAPSADDAACGEAGIAAAGMKHTAE